MFFVTKIASFSCNCSVTSFGTLSYIERGLESMVERKENLLVSFAYYYIRKNVRNCSLVKSLQCSEN